jgi:hypothetical protein
MRARARFAGAALARAGVWLLVGGALLAVSLLIPGVRFISTAVVFIVSCGFCELGIGCDELPDTSALVLALLVYAAVLGVAAWGVVTAVRRIRRRKPA